MCVYVCVCMCDQVRKWQSDSYIKHSAMLVGEEQLDEVCVSVCRIYV